MTRHPPSARNDRGHLPVVLIDPPPRWAWLLQWPAGQRKTVYLCMAILGSCVFIMAIYGLTIWAEHKDQTPGHAPAFGDFFALWSYGKIISDHPASDLYDAGALHGLQVALGMRDSEYNPFPYPPIAILLFRLFRPLTWLSYEAAYVVWALGTLALFVWAVVATCSRLAISIVGVIVAPVSIACLDSGQTGFLNAALLIAGVRLAGSRPIVSGVLIGLLSYKPQMALLTPIAFAAAGHWRAFATACATVILLASITTFAYGSRIWVDWIAMLPVYSHRFDRDALAMQFKPTIMVNLQLAGVALPVAKAVQGLAAVAVAVLVWRCFRRTAGRLAAAALLVGAVLATPHAVIYDLPIVVAAMALFIQERMLTVRSSQTASFSLGEVVILLIGYGFPLLMAFKMGPFDPPVSAVPLLMLFGLFLRDAKREADYGWAARIEA